MSPSLGVCVPYSILLILVKCQEHMPARARPVRPASLRISRRRAPSASRACLTGVVNLCRLVFVVGDGTGPGGLERRFAGSYHLSVSGHLMVKHMAVTVKVGEGHGVPVEQPE